VTECQEKGKVTVRKLKPSGTGVPSAAGPKKIVTVRMVLE